MKLTHRRAAALAAVTALVPVVGVAGPAQAVTCSSASKYTATSISSSTKFDATSTCDGVYAGTAATGSDNVRGRFYKDGGWQVSSYGYVYVSTSSDGWDKIIGNTTTGRDLKGQGQNRSQNVTYLY